MTLDLEVNEGEVKVLTSLASVTGITVCSTVAIFLQNPTTTLVLETVIPSSVREQKN